MELMCNLRIPIDRFEETWKVNFHQYFQEELQQLRPFIEDELVDPNINNEVRVTELGQIIVRPIAMIFDAYLAKARKEGGKTPLFSRTL